MEISGIKYGNPGSPPTPLHPRQAARNPQLAPVQNQQLLPSPKKVPDKHKLLLVSRSSSVFWSVCRALAGATRTWALFWTSGTLSGIWGPGLTGAERARTVRGHRRAPDRAPDCTRDVCSPEDGPWGARASKRRWGSPSSPRIKPKHFTTLWPPC